MTETPFIYAANSHGSRRWVPAFAKGCGGKVVTDGVLQPGPVALFGHADLWPLLKQAKSEGRVWYYGDHAYFWRRRYFRITRNAFQHTGVDHRFGVRPDMDRLRHLGVRIEPWKRGGRHILLCPPDAIYCKRQGFDAGAWQRNVITELKRHTDRPIKVRPRLAADRGPATLREQLAMAHAMVTHHSNAAVEALCFGIPVFTTGHCAARTLASNPLQNIESPLYPDGREAWAGTLAANQWTVEEIASGKAWEALK